MTTIATEFGDSTPHSLSEFYRGGGLVPDAPANSAIPTSGQIALGNFYGAVNQVDLNITISANTQNYDLWSVVSANPGYVAGATNVTLTVNPGVTVGSSSTGTYALQIPSSFNPGDIVSVVNNGTIVGRGGNGGTGGPGASPSVPTWKGGDGNNAGNGMYVNRPVTITNNGTLAGGGGGGGGSSAESLVIGSGGTPKSPTPFSGIVAGGGGGGGAGNSVGDGGSAGTAGSSPAGQTVNVPGSPGTATAGGAGAPQKNVPGGYVGAAGSGGARGAAGSISLVPSVGTPRNPLRGTGGTGGNYLVGNPFVTWSANGTRLGGVS
jgi:hypothetical protein